MRAWILILLGLFVGCRNYGSRTLPKDRYDYSRAVARSWKEQMLLNIVKLRYLDTPVFVEVQQIIAGYTLEGSANVGWSEAGVAEGLALGAGGSYSVRPTITYRPLTGSEFAKNLLQPIPPHGILFLRNQPPPPFG